MRRLTSSPLLLVFLLWLAFALGCSSANNQSSAANSNISNRPHESSNTYNINGTLITYEEQKQITDKVMAEKKRRGLSDRDTLILMDKETQKFIAEKKNRQ